MPRLAALAAVGRASCGGTRCRRICRTGVSVRRSGLWLVVAVVTVGAGWVALAALGDGGPDEVGATPERELQAGVCATIRASTGEDRVDPRVVFYDRAHDGLHELAARVSESDRAVAADLLRSKEQVESLLDERTSRESLTAALRQLGKSTTDAVAVVEPAQAEECE